MGVVDYTLKLLGLTETFRKWQGLLLGLDKDNRLAIARYAEEIAGTLQRAGEAFERLEKDPADKAAQRIAIREFGRLAGYVETVVEKLEHRIDGRSLAGMKRRLETLAAEGLMIESVKKADAQRIERIMSAEGYFRALADSLRP